MGNINITVPTDIKETLEHVLALYCPEQDISVEPHEKSEITCTYGHREKVISIPVRVGHVIDIINDIKNVHYMPEIIVFGKSTLNTHNFIFTKENGSAVSLTEKENNLMVYLYQNKGQTLSREDVLKAVWNYADDVETHTLETHIYRLRKKIEKNPAKPEILITNENGYSVSKL